MKYAGKMFVHHWDKELTKKEIRLIYCYNKNYNWFQSTLIKVRWALSDLKQFFKKSQKKREGIKIEYLPKKQFDDIEPRNY